ncbi:MAG: DUF1868 domain-containing protein, partial [Candidatus Omnitrophota bacterium]
LGLTPDMTAADITQAQLDKFSNTTLGILYDEKGALRDIDTAAMLFKRMGAIYVNWDSQAQSSLRIFSGVDIAPDLSSLTPDQIKAFYTLLIDRNGNLYLTDAEFDAQTVVANLKRVIYKVGDAYVTEKGLAAYGLDSNSPGLKPLLVAQITKTGKHERRYIIDPSIPSIDNVYAEIVEGDIDLDAGILNLKFVVRVERDSKGRRISSTTSCDGEEVQRGTLAGFIDTSGNYISSNVYIDDLSDITAVRMKVTTSLLEQQWYEEYDLNGNIIRTIRPNSGIGQAEVVEFVYGENGVSLGSRSYLYKYDNELNDIKGDEPIMNLRESKIIDYTDANEPIVFVHDFVTDSRWQEIIDTAGRIKAKIIGDYDAGKGVFNPISIEIPSYSGYIGASGIGHSKMYEYSDAKGYDTTEYTGSEILIEVNNVEIMTIDGNACVRNYYHNNKTNVYWQEIKDARGNTIAKFYQYPDPATSGQHISFVEIMEYEAGIGSIEGIAKSGRLYLFTGGEDLKDFSINRYADEIVLTESYLIDHSGKAVTTDNALKADSLVYQYENKVSKLAWQEERDNHGRLTAKYTGVSSRDEQGNLTGFSRKVVEKVVPVGVLGVMHISAMSGSYLYESYIYEEGKPLNEYLPESAYVSAQLINTFGAAVDSLEGIAQDNTITYRYVNHKTHLVWEEVRDGFGRIIRRYDGETLGDQSRPLTEPFKRVLVADQYYQGLIGDFGLSTSSKVYLMDKAGNRVGGPLDQSELLSSKFEKLDLILPSMPNSFGVLKSAFDEKGRIHYQGSRVYRKTDVSGEGLLEYREIKNNTGSLEERFEGYNDENGNFITNLKRYFFYPDSDIWCSFNIAQKTILTVFVDGKEIIFSAANRTSFDEQTGNISYSCKQGKGINNFPQITYNSLDRSLDLLFEKTEGFEYVTHTWQEIKNNRGWLVQTREGFSLDDESNFPIGTPRYITFLKGYSLDMPISSEAHVYKYNDEAGDRLIDGQVIQTRQAESDYTRGASVGSLQGLHFLDNVAIYNVSDTRISRNSINNSGYRIDGRLAWEIHAGKMFRDKVYLTYFNELECADYSVELVGVLSPISGIRLNITNRIFEIEQKLYKKHYTVMISGEPGSYVVWDETPEQDKNVWFAISRFINGDEIKPGEVLSKGFTQPIKDRNIYVTESKDIACSLAKQGGKYFFEGELLYEIKDKFTPVLWKAYHENSIREYISVQFNEHVKNSWLYNMFMESDKRGTLSPAITVAVVSLVFITFMLPLALFLFTFALSRLHFRKLGKKQALDAKGHSRGFGLADQASPEQIPGPERSFPAKASHGRLQAKVNVVGADSEQKIRARIANINRHLYINKALTNYLISFYLKDVNELIKLLDSYYPEGHPERAGMLLELAEFQNIAATNADIEEARYDFVDRVFVKPISYLMLAIMIDQAEKWDWMNKGVLNQQDRKTGELGDNFWPFTDRDMKRLFEYFDADKEDPILKLGLYKYLGLNTLQTWYMDGQIKALKEKPDDKAGVSKEQAKENIKIKKNHKLEKGILIEKAIKPAKEWLAKRYKEEGLVQPVYPMKVNKAINLFWWFVAIGGTTGLVTMAVASFSSFGVIGAVFMGLIWSFVLVETHKMFQYVQFHKNWFQGLWTIFKTRSFYKGPLSESDIKIKKNFFKAYFAWMGTYAAGILVFSLLYSVGSIPWFGWFAAVPILVISLRESFRSWWYIFVEAAATAIGRNQRLDSIKRYEDIKKEQIDRVRGNEYLKDVFKEVLINSTLSVDSGFHLISGKEKELLEDVVSGDSINKLPDLASPHAKQEIVKFFNKVMMFDKDEFDRMYKNINLEQLLPTIFKGTGKKRVIPTVGFLDATDDETRNSEGVITKLKPTGIIKSGFYVFKEEFKESWRIFLEEDILKDAQNKDKLVKKLISPRVKLSTTISDIAKELAKSDKDVENDIILKWITFRADGYLKTLLLAERAGEAAYRVLLRHKFKDKNGRYPEEQELSELLKQHLMFVHVHEDIDPDKEDWGGRNPGEIIKVLCDNARPEGAYTINGCSYADMGSKANFERRFAAEDSNKIVLSTKEFKGGETVLGVPAQSTADKFYDYRKDEAGRWIVKTDKWSITARFIEKFLLARGKSDAVIVNLDRDHFFYPSEYFMLPFVAQRFTSEDKLGYLTTRLTMRTGYVAPTGAAHEVAEDTWNIKVLLAEALIGAHAFYGPGIVRWAVMRDWGAYMSNIEDTAAANEAIMDGMRGDHTPWITWGRPREMVGASILDFQNRFGGLVIDEYLSTHYQKLLKSNQAHWTEKLTLFQNFDFYFNKPLIPHFNLLIFLFSFFINFTPFSFFALPILFVSLGYLFSQAITSGGIRLFHDRQPFFKAWWTYAKRFWGLVFTFVPLIPMHGEKALNAFKGTAGKFSSGIKDIFYPSVSFRELYNLYKPSIRWGVILLGVLLFAPTHPWAIATQIFFHIFPVAFIFGPFMKNAPANKKISISTFGLSGLLFVLNAVFTFMPMSVVIAIIAGAIIAAGISGKEKYTKGITHGLLSILYYLLRIEDIFFDRPGAQGPEKKGKIHAVKDFAKEHKYTRLKTFMLVSVLLPFYVLRVDLLSPLFSDFRPYFNKKSDVGKRGQVSTTGSATALELNLDLSGFKVERFIPLNDFSGKFAGLMNDSLKALKSLARSKPQLYSYLRDILSKQDNTSKSLRIKVLKDLPVNAARYFNETMDLVEIVLNERFVLSLLNDYDAYPVVKYILAERLFHELGHNNVIGAAQEEIEEEARLIDRDLELHSIIPVNFQRKINKYFQEKKPEFPSGYYFAFLDELLPLGKEQRAVKINEYIMRDANLAIGGLTDQAIDALSVDELVKLIFKIPDMRDKKIAHKFLLYSAAPGTGKGEVMDATFTEGKGKYAHLVDKLILYHTRSPRIKKDKSGNEISEKDGIAYHFRSEDELRQLKKDGKIITALINNQLQGMALETFYEEITIQKPALVDSDKAVLLSDDSIIEETDEYIKISRRIHGLKDIFEGSKLVILEGGYGWFESIKKDPRYKEQHKDVLTIFISPFADKEIDIRAGNNAWIDSRFALPEEKAAAYDEIAVIIQELAGEIDLTQNSDLQARVVKAVEDKALLLKGSVACHNARVIDSNEFLKSLKIDIASPGAIDKVKALAYEVNRRLSMRDGEIKFAYAIVDDKAGYDRYQRVLEGIMQIVNKNEYDVVLTNTWGWTDDARKQNIKKLTEEFSKSFFSHVVKGLRDSAKSSLKTFAKKTYPQGLLDMAEKYFGSDMDKALKQLETWKRAYNDAIKNKKINPESLGTDEMTVERLLNIKIEEGQPNATEYFRIVDSDGKYTGKIKPRDLVHLSGANEDWHRSVFVIVVDEKGRMLVQTRSAKKDHAPNARDISVGGHMGLCDDPNRDFNITTKETAQKELQEELFNRGDLNGYKIDSDRLFAISEIDGVRLSFEYTTPVKGWDNELVTVFVYRASKMDIERIDTIAKAINDEKAMSATVDSEVAAMEWVEISDEWKKFKNMPDFNKRINYGAGFIKLFTNYDKDRSDPNTVLGRVVQISDNLKAFDTKVLEYEARLDGRSVSKFAGKTFDPDKHIFRQKVSQDGEILPFAGLTTAVEIKQNTPLHAALIKMQDTIKRELKAEGMDDAVVFLDPASFHMTITDIDPSSAYQSAKTGISFDQISQRLDQMNDAFEAMGA